VEGEKPEAEPKERNMTISKLTEGLGLIEAAIKLPEDIGAASSNN